MVRHSEDDGDAQGIVILYRELHVAEPSAGEARIGCRGRRVEERQLSVGGQGSAPAAAGLGRRSRCNLTCCVPLSFFRWVRVLSFLSGSWLSVFRSRRLIIAGLPTTGKPRLSPGLGACSFPR